MITSALHLEPRLRHFAEQSRDWDGPTFRQHFERLLTDVEMDL
jgi:hypothetical protein